MTKLATGPATVRAGDPVLIVATTANAGKRKAGRSQTEFYLSRDAARSPEDTKLGGAKVKRLKPRRSADAVSELTIPASVAGQFQVIACADDAGAIRESKEKNNCRASRAITVSEVEEDPVPVVNQPPFANLDFAPAVPQVGQQVQFSSLSTDPDGTIAAVAWDLDGDQAFDDGAGSTVSRAFNSVGTFTVRLRVSDDDGASDVDVRQVAVVAAPDPDPDGDDFTAATGDCDSADPDIHPGAADPLEAPFTDSNCDGVDGIAAEAVFVSTGPNAVDSPGSGSRAQPHRTMAGAIVKAQATGKSNVFVAGGLYEETGPTAVVEGISIYGGFVEGGPVEWGRSAGNVTTIFNPVPEGLSNNVRAVVAGHIVSATRLDLLRIVSGSATGTGRSSYGVWVLNSPGLTLDTVTIEAGNGAAGATGSAGFDGVDGVNGSNGSPGQCTNPFMGGSGGIGGIRSDGATAINGGTGGAGGAPNVNGTAGNAGSGPSPGSAGAAGTTATGGPGGDGGDGGDGTDADDGSGGSGGSVSVNLWATNSGSNGNKGVPGSGGGGGGGSRGATVSSTTTGGAGGGGGGSGAAGGGGGFGGGGGGGSFGLFVVNPNPGPGPTVIDSTIRSGSGGAGGIGGPAGRGGFGGVGGEGGLFAAGCSFAIPAGAGGDGGDGGDGGHGGGGAGGPSIGIFTRNTSNALDYANANSLDHGSGGEGGPSLGNPGTTGSATDILSF